MEATNKTTTLTGFWSNINDLDNNHLNILDTLTGSGKTTTAIKYIADNYHQSDFRVAYATNSVQEVLEAVLQMRRCLLGNGKELKYVNRFLRSPGRLAFNFNGSKDLNLCKELLASDNWSDDEKNFIKTIKCETNKFAVKNHVIFTTHQSLVHHTEVFADYTVIIDEIPNFAWNLKPNMKFKASKIKQHHIDTVEMSGAGFIDENFVSLQIYNGLVNVSDFTGKAVVYHLNDKLPFKKTILMTAFSKALYQKLSYLGNTVNVYTTHESAELVDKLHGTLELVSLEKESIINNDASEVRQELLALVNNPSKCFEVSVDSVGEGSVKKIKTNKTGTNSLSDYDECIVVSQRNYNSFERSVYEEKFGKDLSHQIWWLESGACILQSVYRGSLRKGRKMRVLVGSKEIEFAIHLVMAMYTV